MSRDRDRARERTDRLTGDLPEEAVRKIRGERRELSREEIAALSEEGKREYAREHFDLTPPFVRRLRNAGADIPESRRQGKIILRPESIDQEERGG